MSTNLTWISRKFIQTLESKINFSSSLKLIDYCHQNKLKRNRSCIFTLQPKTTLQRPFSIFVILVVNSQVGTLTMPRSYLPLSLILKPTLTSSNYYFIPTFCQSRYFTCHGFGPWRHDKRGSKICTNTWIKQLIENMLKEQYCL